jgi:two-component system response regulator AtoC
VSCRSPEVSEGSPEWRATWGGAVDRTVLVVDDERNMLNVMRMILEDAGYRVLAAESAEAAVPQLQAFDLGAVLSDLKMPGLSGEAFIALCRKERPDVPVLVVTGHGSIRSAVQSLQAGASDYLTKPFERDELLLVVHKAFKLHELLSENRRLLAAASGAVPHKRLIGQGAGMRKLLEEVRRVAPYKTNVLITGESGTGKEAVARALHDIGPRRDHPWVAVNCSAIPRDLMESELFGYVKGAFTGATQSRLGRLEQANGGTLFLDEIGDLDLALQGKLLRVLQEREFSPVGSDALRRVDVRFLAATNRNLKELVRQDRFREDLLYRLDVYNIHVPPLRERSEDVPLLAAAFLQELGADIDKSVEGFTQQALGILSSYSWPGNVRELRNTVERALLTCTGRLIDLPDLPRLLADRVDPARTLGTELESLGERGLDGWLEERERQVILQALKQSRGVQVQAAKQLGISERSLWHRIKKLNIQLDRVVREIS